MVFEAVDVRRAGQYPRSCVTQRKPIGRSQRTWLDPDIQTVPLSFDVLLHDQEALG